MNIRKSVTAGLATVGVVALCGLYGCASCSRVFFDDEQGKRVIIQGGIVMSEED